MSQVIASETEQDRTSARDEAALHLKQASKVFPLPLTPFERYMLVDDRIGYPMTYAFVVELRGEINEQAMESAVFSVMARHPMTCARLRQVGAQELWVEGSLPQQAVTWHQTPPKRLPFGGERFDVRRESGFRVDGYVDGEKPYLVFSMHHAVTDGLGVSQFVGDVLAEYGAITGSGEVVPKLGSLDPSRLSTRGDYEVQLPHPVSTGTVVRSMIRETWKMVSRQPALFAERGKLEQSRNDRNGYVVVSIENEKMIPVREQASEIGATMNQVLIRDLLVALDEWTRQQSRSGSRWLRIAVPTSLRTRRDNQTPATNILGYVFVTRKREECQDEAALLQGIVEELNLVKQWSLGTMFAAAVAFVDRIPGLLRFITRRKRRITTAVLSNLGEVTRRFTSKLPRKNGIVVAGNLELVNIIAAPPVRPGTSLAIAVTECSGKVNFGADFDSQVVSEHEVRAFLESYASRVLGPEAKRDEAPNDRIGP